MKKLLLFFLSLSLLGGHAFGMKRKRQDDDAGRAPKKRKKTSVYEQYLDEKGWYCCPDCDYKSDTKGNFGSHLCIFRHGHLKEAPKTKRGDCKQTSNKKKKKVRASVYDQYLGEDGWYYCRDCEYVGKTKAAMIHHVSRKKHGHMKGREKGCKKVTGICDQYLQDDGFFHCPDCDFVYKGPSNSGFRSHLSSKRHGHLKNVRMSDVYAQYLQDDDLYHCSDCDYVAGTASTIGNHLAKYRHGHLKGVAKNHVLPGKRKGKKRPKKSVCDQYLEDGKYYCPDCDYVGRTESVISNHLSEKRHGHIRGKKRRLSKKRGSKYDQYLQGDGVYHCPDCNYVGGTNTAIRGHMATKRHGHLRGKAKKKRVSSLPKEKKVAKKSILGKRKRAVEDDETDGIKRKKRRKGIVDQYLQKDGSWRCPDCGHMSQDEDAFYKHMHRLYHGHFKGRKKPHMYDRYLGEGDRYHCPDCEFVTESRKAMGNHLSAKRHGHLKGKREKKSVYDQYLDKDGLYCCPDCTYSHKEKKRIKWHMSKHVHGHRKGKKNRYRKLDRYREIDGVYYCPDCSYQGARARFLLYHFYYKRHGHMKGKEKKKRNFEYVDSDYSSSDESDVFEDVVTPARPISMFSQNQSEGEVEVTVLPVLEQPEESNESFLYALFNATCLQQDNSDDMYNREQFERVAESWREQLRKGASVYAFARDGITILDDMSLLDSSWLPEDETTVLVLQVEAGYWIAIKIYSQDGLDHIDIADASYRSFEDFELLFDIAKRVMQG